MDNLDNVNKEIEQIMANALATGKEITFTQASAIRSRSIKLANEVDICQDITPEEKIRQIEYCWYLRDEGKLNHYNG